MLQMIVIIAWQCYKFLPSLPWNCYKLLPLLLDNAKMVAMIACICLIFLSNLHAALIYCLSEVRFSRFWDGQVFRPCILSRLQNSEAMDALNLNRYPVNENRNGKTFVRRKKVSKTPTSISITRETESESAIHAPTMIVIILVLFALLVFWLIIQHEFRLCKGW